MHQTLKLPNKAAVKTIAYVKISANFFLFFFFKFWKPSYSEIKNAAYRLQKAYPEKSYLHEELIQFSYFLNKTCWGIYVAEIFECTSF